MQRPAKVTLEFDTLAFIRKFEKYREDIGFSFRDVEAATGVHYNTVARVVKGTRTNTSSIIKLAYWADINLYEFISEIHEGGHQMKLTLRRPSGRVVADTSK